MSETAWGGYSREWCESADDSRYDGPDWDWRDEELYQRDKRAREKRMGERTGGSEEVA